MHNYMFNNVDEKEGFNTMVKTVTQKQCNNGEGNQEYGAFW